MVAGYTVLLSLLDGSWAEFTEWVRNINQLALSMLLLLHDKRPGFISSRMLGFYIFSSLVFAFYLNYSFVIFCWHKV